MNTYKLYVLFWFEKEGHQSLQFCKAKANNCMLLPLLPNMTGKYLSWPFLRYSWKKNDHEQFGFTMIAELISNKNTTCSVGFT